MIVNDWFLVATIAFLVLFLFGCREQNPTSSPTITVTVEWDKTFSDKDSLVESHVTIGDSILVSHPSSVNQPLSVAPTVGIINGLEADGAIVTDTNGIICLKYLFTKMGQEDKVYLEAECDRPWQLVIQSRTGEKYAMIDEETIIFLPDTFQAGTYRGEIGVWGEKQGRESN